MRRGGEAWPLRRTQQIKQTISVKTDNPNKDQLEAENAELRRRIAEAQEAEQRRAADEKVITEKMEHGLSLQQAWNVIERQRQHEVTQAKAVAGRQEKLRAIVRTARSPQDAFSIARDLYPAYLSPKIIRLEVEEAIRTDPAK